MVKSLKKLLADGKTQSVINRLRSIAIFLDKEIKDDILLISSRYKTYLRDKNRGELSIENQQVQLATINTALLSIINQLPQGFIRLIPTLLYSTVRACTILMVFLGIVFLVDYFVLAGRISEVITKGRQETIIDSSSYPIKSIKVKSKDTIATNIVNLSRNDNNPDLAKNQYRAVKNKETLIDFEFPEMIQSSTSFLYFKDDAKKLIRESLKSSSLKSSSVTLKMPGNPLKKETDILYWYHKSKVYLYIGENCWIIEIPGRRRPRNRLESTIQVLLDKIQVQLENNKNKFQKPQNQC